MLQKLTFRAASDARMATATMAANEVLARVAERRVFRRWISSKLPVEVVR